MWPILCSRTSRSLRKREQAWSSTALQDHYKLPTSGLASRLSPSWLTRFVCRYIAVDWDRNERETGDTAFDRVRKVSKVGSRQDGRGFRRLRLFQPIMSCRSLYALAATSLRITSRGPVPAARVSPGSIARLPALARAPYSTGSAPAPAEPTPTDGEADLKAKLAAGLQGAKIEVQDVSGAFAKG